MSLRVSHCGRLELAAVIDRFLGGGDLLKATLAGVPLDELVEALWTVEKAELREAVMLEVGRRG